MKNESKQYNERIERIYQIAKDHFDRNPNDEHLELEKNDLASEIGIGKTTMSFLCKSLPFWIENHTGFIRVSKMGFDKYTELRNKRTEKIAEYYKNREDYKQIEREVSHVSNLVRQQEEELNPLREQLAELKKKEKEIEEEKKKIKPEIEKKKPEFDKLLKEYNVLKKDLSKETTKVRKQEAENKRIADEINGLTPRRMEYWLKENSITDRILKGFMWFFGYYLLIKLIGLPL